MWNKRELFFKLSEASVFETFLILSPKIYRSPQNLSAAYLDYTQIRPYSAG